MADLPVSGWAHDSLSVQPRLHGVLDPHMLCLPDIVVNEDGLKPGWIKGEIILARTLSWSQYRALMTGGRG